MADEAKVASITLNSGTSINTDNSFGNIKGSNEEQTEILKQILATMRKNNDTQENFLNLSKTGLIGAAMALGNDWVSTILSGAGKAVTSGIASTAAYEQNNGSTMGYEEVFINGKKQFLQIDKTTGKIIDTLNVQEANQRGILDETGHIYDNLKLSDDIWNSMKKGWTDMNGNVVLTNQTMDNFQKDLQNLTSQYINYANNKWFGSGSFSPEMTPTQKVNSNIKDFYGDNTSGQTALGLLDQVNSLYGYDSSPPSQTAAQTSATISQQTLTQTANKVGTQFSTMPPMLAKTLSIPVKSQTVMKIGG